VVALTVETDAKYIKGMLSNPGIGPNCAIMRWIDYSLMYHFTLRHIPRKAFAADGLSRWDAQPGNDEYPPDKDWVDEPDGSLKFEYHDLKNDVPDAKDNVPLEFEEFKDEIDTRRGYLVVDDQIRSFMVDVDNDHLCTEEETGYLEPVDTSVDWKRFGLPEVPKETVYFISPIMLPDISLKLNKENYEAYEEDRCTKTAKSQDAQLDRIRRWLVDPHAQLPDSNHSQYVKFARHAKQFYLDENDKLFWRALDGKMKAVVEKTHRMYIMRSLHDHLGHKGAFATKELISEWFW